MAETALRPLEVFAVDANMNRASGTIPYTSLTWSRRYHECGQFSMVVPADVYDPSWAYIYADARPETGIVQKVEYSDTAHTPDGIDTVTVSGFFLECFLNRLTFLVEQPEDKTIEIKIPEPKTPGIMRKDMPKAYRDPETGKYMYQNAEGDLVTEDGVQVDGRADYEEVHTTFTGMTEVDATWGALPTDKLASNYNFKTEDGKITLVSWYGQERTYDIVMEDDRGNVYYKTPGYPGEGGYAICIANACATRSAVSSYYSRKRAWDAAGGVRYETITVKGPWQRTDTMEPITESDSVDQLFKWLQTFFGSTFKYEEPDFEGVVKTLDPSLQRMGDFAYSVLQEVGASLRVVYGFENDTLVLEAYKGKDRTQEQTELPWTVFSDTWGTIYDYTASRDTSNYCNTCYVLYSYDQPKSFDSDGTPHLTEIYDGNETDHPSGWKVEYETRRGYQTASVKGDDGSEPTIECYLDLRDSGGAPACDSEWSRDEYAYDAAKENYGKPTLPAMKAQYEEWPDALTAKGVAELEQSYGVVTNLDTGTVVTSGYMVDWDLGDVVEFGVSTVGLMSQARIVGVDEVYESGRADVRITVGDELLTDTKKQSLN